MTIGANAQVSVTDKLAGFASNAADISAPPNPFELSRILSTSSHRNIDSLFLSPALRALGDDGYLDQALATKKEADIQTRLLMAIEMKQQRIAATEKAMEDAERKSNEKNQTRQRITERQEQSAPVASRTSNITTHKDRDDERPKLSRSFNREAPGIVDSALETGKRALETADKAVTETVKVARRTAGDAVEATAEAVGLDGKAARRTVRDAADSAASVVGTAFKVAANPVGAAIEYGAPAAKAVGNAAYNAASSGYNWLFGK